MKMIKRFLLFPFTMFSLFVNKLLNYEAKKTKKNGKECYEEDDGSLSFIERRINKIKNQPLESQKFQKSITYQSVWCKFSLLVFLTFTTGLITYLYFREIENCKAFLDKFHDFTRFLGIESWFYQLWNEKDFSWKFFLPLLLSFLMFPIILFIWFISFYRAMPLLKPMTYLLSIFFGFFLGSFFALCKTCWSLVLGKWLVPLLFIVPLLATIFSLVFVTYLYRFKKVKLTLGQKTKIINYFFIICLLQFIIIHIVSSSLWITILFAIANICEFVLASFLWMVALDELDICVNIKFPKKYEYLIINLMFMSVIIAFVSIFNLIFELLKLLKISSNN